MFRFSLKLSVIGLVAMSITASPAQAQTAVQFNGTSQYITMGAATNGLGASAFTLECWFRRTGPGAPTSTGTLGFMDNVAIPLIAKGRGEADGNNLDANYFLGIHATAGVLIADFEQIDGAASPPAGQNHPICGSTVIPADGVWRHAAATYSATTGWQLYLNGVPETLGTACSQCSNTPPTGNLPNCTANPGVNPRHDSVQHFGIATALTSTGVAAGFFAGAIDEARVWNIVRTTAEIEAGRNIEITSAPGLVGRWGFNENTGVTVSDSTSAPGTVESPVFSHGTLVGGATWVAGAPVLNEPPPNAPTLISPEDNAVAVDTAPTLTVNVTDPEADPLTVTFFGRPMTVPAPGPDFTIVVLPDTQRYVCGSPCGSDSAILNAQLQWIVDNRESRNIAFVTQLGDCVENGNNGNGSGPTAEWDAASAAYNLIESISTPMLTHGLPFGIAVGNHDQTPAGTARTGGDEGATTTRYNDTFGVNRFNGRPYYGGRYDFGAPATYPNNNDNHYELFSAGGLDFIIIHLEYEDTASATRTAVLNWANGLLQTHANRRGIVTAHYILNPNGTFGNQGQAIYDALKGNPNLFMLLCGHLDQANRRADTFNGNTIHTLLSDYQTRPSGGRGWMRRMTFSPANNTIHVETFSPWANYPNLPRQEQLINSHGDNLAGTPQNDFVLNYSMSESAPAFTQIGPAQTGVASGSDVSVAWPDLAENTLHEWKVTVSDGTSTIQSPVWRFTTACTSDGQCDDENPCTADACSDGECVNTPTADACDDGDLCTTDDQCADGQCAGTPVNCFPGQLCNPATGACEFPPVTLTFQNGDANGYAGTVDTYLYANAPTQNFATAVEVQVDAPGPNPPDAKHGLLRFNGIFGNSQSQIPEGATINSAILQVNITNFSVDARTLHRMIQPWSDTDTWTSRGAGIQADGIEARSTADSTATKTTAGVEDIDVTADLIAWQSGESNNGWVIFCTSTDGWSISSAQATTQSTRPRLTVTYTPPPPCENNAECDDGNACTTDECIDNVCTHTPVICDDDNACTDDTCDPAEGCQFSTVNCDDNDGCTFDDCDSETGCSHAPIDCNDDNPCTADFCQPANLAALSFNGSNQYVNLGNAASVSNFGAGSFTIEGWLRLNANAAGANVSLFRLGRQGAFCQAVVQILSNTNSIAASVETTATGTQVDTATGIAVPLNTWTHVAAVADRTPGAQRLKLYVNGTLVSDVNAAAWATNPVASADASLLAASRTDNGSLNGFLNGSLDEIRLWNTARTAAEIQATMNTQLTAATGLIARWGLNEAAGATATDTVGATAGSLTGNPTWITTNLVNLGTGGCTNQAIPGCCIDAGDCDDLNPCTIDTCDSGMCAFTPIDCGPGENCNPSTGNCENAPITVSYRQGENDYTGAVDTYIVGTTPSTAHAADTPLVVDFSPLSQTLLRFDNLFGTGPSQIPTGATIVSAALTINVSNSTAQGARLHRMLQPWTDAETWNTLGAGVQANDIESASAPDVILINVPSGIFDIDVTTSLQAWTASPQNNFGWVWIPPNVDDALQFASSEASPLASRPRLSVTYTASEACSDDADCDDNDPCTQDECDEFGECAHTPFPNCCDSPTDCDDQDPCTLDSCVANECVHQPNPTICDDQNPCTIDTCSDAMGSAIAFDGNGDYLDFGPAASHPELGLTRFTVECWFMRTGPDTEAVIGINNAAGIPLVGRGRGVGDGGNPNIDINYTLVIRQDKIAGQFESYETPDGNNDNPVTGSTTITNNVWHHAAMTFDGAFFRVYLDGIEDGVLATTNTPHDDTTLPFAIATTMDQLAAPIPGGFFQGQIDEVRVWNHARSAADIQADMNRAIPSAPGLVGRWAMDENAGASASDSTSAGNHASLVGQATWKSAGIPELVECEHAPQSAPDCQIFAPVELCAGAPGAASVADAGAGAIYQWSITSGAITSDPALPAITFNAGADGTTELHITVTHADGCHCSASVFVNVVPCVELTLQVPGMAMNPPAITGITRDVFVTLTTCGDPLTQDERTISATFTTDGTHGQAVLLLQNVNPNLDWIAARTAHSLTAAAPVELINGTAGVSLSLNSGDLRTAAIPQDNVIDILDFAILAARWNSPVADCPIGLPESCNFGADVSGDGIQNLTDFQAIQINYFLTGSAAHGCDMGGAGSPGHFDDLSPAEEAVLSLPTPKTRIPLPAVEIVVPRASHIDLNRDGLIDARDIEAFAKKHRIQLKQTYRAKLTAPASATTNAGVLRAP